MRLWGHDGLMVFIRWGGLVRGGIRDWEMGDGSGEGLEVIRWYSSDGVDGSAEGLGIRDWEMAVGVGVGVDIGTG